MIGMACDERVVLAGCIGSSTGIGIAKKGLAFLIVYLFHVMGVWVPVTRGLML